MWRSDELGGFCSWLALSGRSASSPSALLQRSAPQSWTESKQTSCSAFPKKPSSHVLCDTSRQGRRAWALLGAGSSLLTLTSIPVWSMLFYSILNFESYTFCVMIWSSVSTAVLSQSLDFSSYSGITLPILNRAALFSWTGLLFNLAFSFTR